jgi:ribosomal protein S21
MASNANAKVSIKYPRSGSSNDYELALLRKALTKFKRLVTSEGIVAESVRRQEFEGTREKRARKAADARRK